MSERDRNRETEREIDRTPERWREREIGRNRRRAFASGSEGPRRPVPRPIDYFTNDQRTLSDVLFTIGVQTRTATGITEDVCAKKQNKMYCPSILSAETVLWSLRDSIPYLRNEITKER